MTWHLEHYTVQRYQSGILDRSGAASVEAHLMSCYECRSLLTVNGDWLERSWFGVADRVEPGRPSLIERGLTKLRVPGWLARIVSVSPSLRLPFLLAMVFVTGFAVLASNVNPGSESYRVFLMVAPLVPVAGVAVAYGRIADPAFEMISATPINRFGLLMIRTATVLAVAIVVGLVSWPFVPTPSSMGTATWLLPALALTLSTLAVGSRLEMWLSAAMVAGSWVLAISLTGIQGIDVFDRNAAFVHTTLGLLASGWVVLNRNRYGRGGER